MIRSRRTIAAPPQVVHELLTDTAAWRLWAPHVSWVDGPAGPVRTGWSGLVKPWFGPPVQMTVVWSQPARGMRWISSAAGHRLEYAQLIEPATPAGCVVTMSAEVAGPAGRAVEAGLGWLSAYGQRRRLDRLADLSEYLASAAGQAAS